MSATGARSNVVGRGGGADQRSKEFLAANSYSSPPKTSYVTDMNLLYAYRLVKYIHEDPSKEFSLEDLCGSAKMAASKRLEERGVLPLGCSENVLQFIRACEISSKVMHIYEKEMILIEGQVKISNGKIRFPIPISNEDIERILLHAHDLERHYKKREMIKRIQGLGITMLNINCLVDCYITDCKKCKNGFGSRKRNSKLGDTTSFINVDENNTLSDEEHQQQQQQQLLHQYQIQQQQHFQNQSSSLESSPQLSSSSSSSTPKYFSHISSSIPSISFTNRTSSNKSPPPPPLIPISLSSSCTEEILNHPSEVERIIRHINDSVSQNLNNTIQSLFENLKKEMKFYIKTQLLSYYMNSNQIDNSPIQSNDNSNNGYGQSQNSFINNINNIIDKNDDDDDNDDFEGIENISKQLNSQSSVIKFKGNSLHPVYDNNNNNNEPIILQSHKTKRQSPYQDEDEFKNSSSPSSSSFQSITFTNRIAPRSLETIQPHKKFKFESSETQINSNSNHKLPNNR